MPIYEFYCSPCHTVFSFFSASIDTAAQPSCPACGRPKLERRPSRFAMLKHKGQDEPDPLGDLDDARLEGVMDSLMEEVGDLGDDEDPRLLARVFRRFSEQSGLELGEKMEEMMSRLEAGEDPDQLEQEMDGDFDDDDVEQLFRLKRQGWKRTRRPRVDETLHFL